MKDFLTQEMTDKEIKTGLNLFKKLLTKRADLYEIKNANPLKENCYISSSGVIIGVYFPNSIIKARQRSLYRPITISKVNNKLGLVFALNEDIEINISKEARARFSDYIFNSFDELLYTREENQIREEINKRIKEYERNLETLNKIKRVYKKNGDNFARLLDNFEGVNLCLDYAYFSPVVVSVKVNYNDIILYRDDKTKEQNNTPTIEEIETLINEAKERYKKYLEQERQNLKNLERDFKKFEKLTKAIKTFYNQTPNKYDFKRVLDNMIV